MAERLEDEELKEALEDLEIWGLEAGKLSTRIEFDDYKKSVFFANTVFTLAESHFHHPEVKIEYGVVEIDLWSHEEEAITEKDIELAEEITEKVRSIDWN